MFQMHTSVFFMEQRINIRKASTRNAFEVVSDTNAAARPEMAIQHSLLRRSSWSLAATACVYDVA
jgi:hypothetical protein